MQLFILIQGSYSVPKPHTLSWGGVVDFIHHNLTVR